jgi:predicted ATPase
MELVLVDQRTNTVVSHRDVGIGISQVLPVLVSCYANEGQLLTIEQPEIHLHPALQAELGDVFINSALGKQKNNFILETHSEHLILRVLKRIRETTANKNGTTPAIKPGDVSLLFVGPGKNGSEVIPIGIDEHGRLIDRVPGGFFEEDFAELF